MSATELLILRRDDKLWGVARTAIRSFRSIAGHVRVDLAGCSLHADAVVGVCDARSMQPAGAVLRRYWPQPCLGLAIFSGSPLVVVDPSTPPGALGIQEGEADDGDQPH